VVLNDMILNNVFGRIWKEFVMAFFLSTTLKYAWRDCGKHENFSQNSRSPDQDFNLGPP
jgi:hypothetical protein